MNKIIVARKNVTDIQSCVTILEFEFSQGGLHFLKTNTIDRTDDLKAFLTRFPYMKDVFVFTDLVFNRLILYYCKYMHVEIHNMGHTVSEYQLLYGPFHLYNSPFLTNDACTKSSLFQF
jgi:hypothetical protein